MNPIRCLKKVVYVVLAFMIGWYAYPLFKDAGAAKLLIEPHAITIKGNMPMLRSIS